MGLEVILPAAASLIGGAMSADAAEGAAETQANATRDASRVQREIFDRQVELQEPWRQAGMNALSRILSGLDGDFLRDFSAADFNTDPGYGFRMDQGIRALQRGQSAGGRLNSGRAGKDFMRFGQGLASEEYGNAFNRFTTQRANRFNRLASISGLGQTAANQTGAAAGEYGRSVTDLTTQAGNAAAAGRVGSANAWNSAIGQGLSAYQQNRLLDTLRQPAPPVIDDGYSVGQGGAYGGSRRGL